MKLLVRAEYNFAPNRHGTNFQSIDNTEPIQGHLNLVFPLKQIAPKHWVAIPESEVQEAKLEEHELGAYKFLLYFQVRLNVPGA